MNSMSAPRDAVLGELVHDRASPPDEGWFSLGVDGYFDVDNACWCEFQEGDAPWTSQWFDLHGTLPGLLVSLPVPALDDLEVKP